MALCVRNACGRPLSAVSVGPLSKLRPLFLRDFRGDGKLGYRSFRRVVLEEALGLKLEPRVFANVMRACDRSSSGLVSFQSFVDFVRNEELLALAHGVAVEPRGTKKATTVAASHFASGAGISRQRLRRELHKKQKSTKTEEPTQQRPATSRPRRGLLRHEITELRGAGILLTEGQILRTIRTVAQDSWGINPSKQQPLGCSF